MNKLAIPVWRLALPFSALLAVGYGLVFVYSTPPKLTGIDSTAHLVGTLLMLILLPGYLLAALRFLHRETELTLKALAPMHPDATEAYRRLHTLPRGWPIFLLFAGLFGLQQNDSVVAQLMRGDQFAGIDLTIMFGNTLLWMIVGVLLAWRLPMSMALRQFGLQLYVDLYDMDKVRPLTHLATRDVLVVAGAMAFMPLQALDAEFRWANYQAGLFVGLPAAVFMLLLPLMGVRRAIRNAKAARVAELNHAIADTAHSDFERLETLCAHRARIRSLSDWPFDAQAVLKLMFYAVIAPMAWVAAALVEMFVENLAG